MNMKKKILVTTSTFNYEEIKKAFSVDILSNFEFTFNEKGRKITSDELDNFFKITKFDGIIAGLENYSKDFLFKESTIKVISRVGIGIDNIDISTTDQLGIRVFNTPDSPTEAVSHLIIGFILNYTRLISKFNLQMKKNSSEKIEGKSLSMLTIGFIGMGRIGQHAAKLLINFNPKKIVYYDPITNIVVYDKVNLQTLYQISDIICLTISDKNFKLISSDFSSMIKVPYIINTSRGTNINEKDLIDAIKNQKISGAALDVFEKEPNFNFELSNYDQITLTPHIGSFTKETRLKMEIEAVQNLVNHFLNYDN